MTHAVGKCNRMWYVMGRKYEYQTGSLEDHTKMPKHTERTYQLGYQFDLDLRSYMEQCRVYSADSSGSSSFCWVCVFDMIARSCLANYSLHE